MRKYIVFIIFVLFTIPYLINAENSETINEYKAVFTNSKGEVYVTTNTGKSWHKQINKDYTAVLTRSKVKFLLHIILVKVGIH